MSSRDYGYADYGLVLDKETIKHMYTEAINNPEELEDMVYALYEHGICEYIGDFTGEALWVEDNSNDDWNNTIIYSGDTLCYVPLGRYPSLFEAQYESIQEIVDIFKSKVGEYMPEGYDYRANIRHIIGTTFG